VNKREQLQALLAEKKAALAAAAGGAPSPQRHVAPPAARPAMVPESNTQLEVATRGATAMTVQPPRQAALVVPGLGSLEGIHGMENVNQSDLILPGRFLAHAMSTRLGGAPVGTFFNNLAETWSEYIDMVVLRFGRGMVFYDKEDRQAPALCGSNDGFEKRAEYKGLNDFGPDCLTCPMAQWIRYDDGSSTPPACKMVRSFFCIEEKDGIVYPFIYSCMKTAAKPARKFISNFVMSKIPFYSNHVRLTSRMTTNEKGDTWPLPVFTIGKATDRKKYERIYLSYEGVALKHETTNEEEEENGGGGGYRGGSPNTSGEDWDPPGFEDQPEMSDEDKAEFEKHLATVLED